MDVHYYYRANEVVRVGLIRVSALVYLLLPYYTMGEQNSDHPILKTTRVCCHFLFSVRHSVVSVATG